MKIAVVTLLGNNYGGMLQAFALKKVLMNQGFEIIHIDVLPPNKLTIKDIIKKFFYYNRNKKFSEFKKNFMIKRFESIDEKQLQALDIVVVGSDQVWNQNIDFEIRKKFLLNFCDKQRKIAYAASSGRDNVVENEREEIGKLLDKFDSISMREATGVRTYQPLTKNKIVNVLDPTLLLTSEQWNEICVPYKHDEEYIFSYMLGPSKGIIQKVDSIASLYNLKIVDVSYKKVYKNMLKNENNFGPREFIGAIKSSSLVLTNSFHGTVFSIIYKKDFFVFTRGNMNSRIYDLLSLLDLTGRIIDEESLDKKVYMKPIDFDKVYEKFELQKEFSLEFLLDSLS